MNSLRIDDLESIEDTIKSLKNNDEYIRIFSIIKEENVRYTENQNGIHFILNNIPESALQKIVDFLNFILDNRNKLSEREVELSNISQQVDEIVEDDEDDEVMPVKQIEESDTNEDISSSTIPTLNHTKPVYKGTWKKIIKDIRIKNKK